MQNNGEQDKEQQTYQTSAGFLEACGIYLFTRDVTSESCSDCMKFILEANLNPGRLFDKVQLIINSPGGDLESAFALSDIIQGSRLPVYTTGIGLIASAGLLIFMAGARGHRTITPNTMILSHQWSWGTHGKEHELLATVKAVEMTKSKVIEHYREFTGLTEKKIRQYLLPPSDVWISAEEALKLKIADRIVSPKQKIEEVLT